MRPNSRQMALRDPALAARLGILGGKGANYGADFGEWYGDPDGGGMAGLDAGFGFGADPSAPLAAAAAAQQIANPMHPAHAAHTRAVLAAHHQANARTHARETLINPNKGSKFDIERYDFSVQTSVNIVIGTASTLTGMRQNPAVTVRPQRCVFSAPSLFFAQITSILAANVNGIVGGSLDAGAYGPGSFGVHLDLPTINPANTVVIQGSYSGITPTGIPLGLSTPFTASFQCPATVVPNPSLGV